VIIAEVERRCRAVEGVLSRVIVGKDAVIRQLLAGVLASGHILIEDYPGLAKTLIARLLGEALDLAFRRVQFTPDLLPGDITGSFIYDQHAAKFEFRRGPIFTQLLLADEINRATPKTQSALLEAMQEHQVTVEGETFPLDTPFLVVATQNPIDLEGTYPLPEAQMDRFLFKVVMTSPKPDELREIMKRTTGAHMPVTQSIFEPSVAAKQIEALKTLVREVIVAEPLERYAIAIVAACTPNGPGAVPEVSQYLRFGPSPRGLQAIILCSKVNALLDGRVSVSYDDIDDAVVPSLRHRLLRNFQAEAENVSTESILEQVMKRVKRPRT